MCPTRRSRTAKQEAAAADQLTEYRRKRDFERTREPAGGKQRTRRGNLQFVIQKHAASHLHYDLRLELDGVMKSWAVPKGPSLDPADKRLAMQVEDHPVEYNTFEGTIPKGEYGGGTVMLWDRGTYHPDEPKAGESDADAVRRGLRSGKLSFSFEGERLRGSFALVRTSGGEKPKWLLIKHRDETADAGSDITADVLTSVDTGRTMEEIASGSERVWRSNRGGSKGGEERARARAEPAAPELAPMQPTPAREAPAEDSWQYEIWRGGERVLVYATPAGARIVAGKKDITKRHRAAAEELGAFARRVKQSFVIDAEIEGDGADATVHVSDLLLSGEHVLMQQPRSERRSALEALFHRRRVKGARLQQVFDDAVRALRAAASEGASGILAHRLDGEYAPGTRSDDLLRIPLR